MRTPRLREVESVVHCDTADKPQIRSRARDA